MYLLWLPAGVVLLLNLLIFYCPYIKIYLLKCVQRLARSTPFQVGWLLFANGNLTVILRSFCFVYLEFSL